MRALVRLRYAPCMKHSTSYFLGAISFLLISGYMILTPASDWYEVLAIALTFVGGLTYLVYGIRELRAETMMGSPTTNSSDG